jgi:hypothetical protein
MFERRGILDTTDAPRGIHFPALAAAESKHIAPMRKRMRNVARSAIE